MTFVIELMRSFLGEYLADVVGRSLPSLSEDELSGRTGSTEDEHELLVLALVLALALAQAQLQGETWLTTEAVGVT